MSTNKNYSKLTSILSTLEEKEISTTAELKSGENQKLWTELYFATQDFINFYALESKTTTNKKGEIVPGNKERVKTLINDGGMELYDIQMDILIHIMNKMDLVLAQSPAEKKANYIYKIVNNKVIDMLEKLPPVVEIPWDTSIKSDKSEDGAVLAEIIGDNTYNPERLHLEYETIKELKKVLKAKREKEIAEKKNAIISELKILAGNPSEILVHMGCCYLNLKPRDVANNIVNKGAENTYINILSGISKKYNITLDEIRNSITGKRINSSALKADSNDPKQISAEVSREKYRAAKTLKKDK